jgi:hypothetical protein
MRTLFFILFFQIVSSQEPFKTIDNFLFDSSNGVFKIISGDSIFSYDLNKNLVHKAKFLENDYDVKALFPLVNKSFSYYPSNETGVVVDSKLNRIDNTKTKNFFMNSRFFVNNDTLFRVGGYGFWTKYRGVSYYNASKNNWHAYTLNSIDENYVGALNPLLTKLENNIYLVYSGVVFDDKNPLHEYANNNVFKLDLNKKQISYEGNSSIALNGKPVFTDNNTTVILRKTGLIILDWKNNLVKKFNTSWTPKVSQKFNVFLVEDEFYYIEQNKGTFKLASSKYNFTELKPFFVSEIIEVNRIKFLFIGLACFGVLMLIYFYFKKFNQIKLHKTHLQYRFKKLGINEFEYEIVKVLSLNQKITTNQIHGFLNTKDLHPNHVYRLIPEVMRDLAKTFNLLTSNNNLVFSISKNKTDRRIREYLLAKEFKIRVKK